MRKKPKAYSKNHSKTTDDFLFHKKYKVSIWASKTPYEDIPDEYFEETYSKNKARAQNSWSKNFKIRYFNPESLETNGSQQGLLDIKQVAGQCSYSTSFIDNLMSKAIKKNITEVSWLILIYEFEYSAKISGVESDEYVTLLGAFNYDDDADNLFELENQESESQELNPENP
ncbi:MAG: hypothetical protein COA86_13110 [Kangiella sp.]|nr:MAG: hypothetical protein COA86_13110 [Kangiella sp.]